MSAVPTPIRRNSPPVDLTRLRGRMADAIERLIVAMDLLDADADLEDSDDAEAVNEDGDALDSGESGA